MRKQVMSLWQLTKEVLALEKQYEKNIVLKSVDNHANEENRADAQREQVQRFRLTSSSRSKSSV